MQGSTRTGRSTLYKGVRMRSRLEANFARTIDGGGPLQWEYEPCCFADESGDYLPDFRITRDDWPVTYVEIKPASIGTAEIEDALERLEIIWASEPDVRLTLFLWEHSEHETGAAGFIEGYPDEAEDPGYNWWCHPNTLDRLRIPDILKRLCGDIWPESRLVMWPGRGQLLDLLVGMEQARGGTG